MNLYINEQHFISFSNVLTLVFSSLSSCKSYDGTGPGYGGAGLNDQPQQPQQPTAAGSRQSRIAQSSTSNTASSSSSSGSSGSTGGGTRYHHHHQKDGSGGSVGSSVHWRTSSVGAAAVDHPRGPSKSPAHIGKGASQSGQQQLGKMADLNIQRGHSPNFSPSRNNSQPDIQTLHVHLPNHGFRMIRFDEASDVRQIINLIVGSMSPSQKTNPQSYALRLRHMLTKEVSVGLAEVMLVDRN